ncbi:hypothetical protein L6R29_08095 [Myxococcota bacterium]|nr:hypothetical protein [Myxococcota bacterium]
MSNLSFTSYSPSLRDALQRLLRASLSLWKEPIQSEPPAPKIIHQALLRFVMRCCMRFLAESRGLFSTPKRSKLSSLWALYRALSLRYAKPLASALLSSQHPPSKPFGWAALCALLAPIQSPAFSPDHPLGVACRLLEETPALLDDAELFAFLRELTGGRSARAFSTLPLSHLGTAYESLLDWHLSFVSPSQSTSLLAESPPFSSTEASDVSTEASDVPTEASDVPTEASDVSTEASDVPTEASDVPTEASDVSTEASDVSSQEQPHLHESDKLHLRETNERSLVFGVWEGMRKGGGTFYTEPRLAELTVQRAWAQLDPEQKDRATAFSIKVCDPAMGAGVFLLAALDCITSAIQQASCERAAACPNENDAQSARPSDHFASVGEGEQEHRIVSVGEGEQVKIRRCIVRSCLYGVDRDPLAVEIARFGLWLAVGDPQMPFAELTVHLRCGDALLGSLPSLESESEPSHIFANSRYTGKISEHALSGSDDPSFAVSSWPEYSESSMAWQYTDARCALWFWPEAQRLHAPTSAMFEHPLSSWPVMTQEISQRIAKTYNFFHWPLAFPEIFSPSQRGFDMIVGNPPWETLQPNAREFFSAVAPSFRLLRKQQALVCQSALLADDPHLAVLWKQQQDDCKQIARWLKHPMSRNTQRKGHETQCDGHEAQHQDRATRHNDRKAPTNAALPTPFRYQGEGKPYTYKLFLELAYHLLRSDGHLAMLVPASLYSDKGADALRRLFLSRCRWKWLFSFENRSSLFAIDPRFKFCAVILQKGGRTKEVQTAFMQRTLEDWAHAEEHAQPYPKKRIQALSPHSLCFFELQHPRDIELLDKIIEHTEPLPKAQAHFPLVYQQGEFNMTSHSRHFLSCEQAEAQGFKPTLYGHRLRGVWKAMSKNSMSARKTLSPVQLDERQADLDPEQILSADGGSVMSLSSLRCEDILLPLYQGAMLYDYSHNAAAYWGGTGYRSRWVRHDPLAPPQSQFFVPPSLYREWPKAQHAPRIAFRALSNATNERALIVSCLTSSYPCGNSIGLFAAPQLDFPTPALLAHTALMGSLIYDWLLRHRLVGTNLNAFLMAETRLPALRAPVTGWLGMICARLCFAGVQHAPFWLRWQQEIPQHFPEIDPLLAFPNTPIQRQILHSALDAACSALFGLNRQDLHWILRDCAHPTSKSLDPKFTRTLDPKGFWRIHKQLPPDLRHTVRTLAMFDQLQQRGLEDFLSFYAKPFSWVQNEPHASTSASTDSKRKQSLQRAKADVRQVFEQENWRRCHQHAQRLAWIEHL